MFITNLNQMIKFILQLDIGWVANWVKGIRKSRTAVCIDDRNESHSIERIKYDKNGIIVTADLVGPWNYKDWIGGDQIKIVAYKKPKR